MNIAIVVDETAFFHPLMLEQVANTLQNELARIYVVTKVPKRGDIRRNLIESRACFPKRDLGNLVGLLAARRCGRQRSWSTGAKVRFSSVTQTAKRLGLPHGQVTSPVELLSQLRLDFPGRTKSLDLLISSQSLIFPPEILQLPSLGCINRHSGLLPAYGGLWPVVHALRRGESRIGASVHQMTPEIDGGRVITQADIPADRNKSVFWHYEQTFRLSGGLITDAVERLRHGQPTIEVGSIQRSYFSMPTCAEWKQLFDLGWKFT